jgi:serine phosphatase RsbU (regulator of sigma subunit)
MALTMAFALLAIPQTPSEVRWELAGVAIGFILLSIGLAALALFLFRRQSRDPSLLYFSSFSLLYAIRLLFRESIIRYSFPVSAAVWNHLDVLLDCVIIIPFTLFLIQIVEPRWKRILRGVVAVQIIFGSMWLLSNVLAIGQKAMSVANNLLVIACCALIAFFYIPSQRHKSPSQSSQEIKIVFGGLAVFAFFVIEGNLADLHVIPRHHNIEPLGFFIFVCCLGYVAARRTLAKEERLLAIGKELQIATQIQTSILPREVPRLPGLEIAARYLPMSDVAGDFYDFLLVDDKHVGVLVADVTGHGVPAALIASMLKVAFAGQAANAEDPARVLTGLNRALCGKFEAHFVTAAYVFVDLEQNKLRYAGAGHPHPILSPAADHHGSSGNAQEIEANGLMLGLFPEATYFNVELPVRARDRFLLYTDGISEAANPAHEEFGKTRLKQFFTASSQSASHLLDALLLEIARWSNTGSPGRQEDDITLLLLDFQ